jgi:phage repressor protein C with HTH and peptisase S24 domain
MRENSQWNRQLEVIRKKVSEAPELGGHKITYQNMADLLNVSKGKVEAWHKGQRPSADDLEKIGKKLGLSAHWLLYGEGQPEGNGSGRRDKAQRTAVGPTREHIPQVCEKCSERFPGYIVPVHSTISSGQTREHWEPEPQYHTCIPESFWNPEIMVVQVEGSSMQPLIRKGALVGINVFDTRVISGEIYAIRVPYEGLNLKRIFVDPEKGSIRLTCENSSHPDQMLSFQEREDFVVGKVVWVMQEI